MFIKITLLSIIYIITFSLISKIIIPILFFVAALIVDKPFPDFLPGFTTSEMGLVENLQALCLLLAFITACYLLKHAKAYPKWIKGWISLGIAGSLYVFLEEISYGQHYFNWNTPEYWQNHNDQKETNLHNIVICVNKVTCYTFA